MDQLLALLRAAGEPTRLPLSNVHLVGPFENAGYQGLLRTYPPEQEIDLTASYEGKAGEVNWRRAPGLADSQRGESGLRRGSNHFEQYLPTLLELDRE